jgi:hypothetical protein
MRRALAAIAAITLLATAATAADEKKPDAAKAPPAAPALEPKAVDVLKAMSATLAAAKTMSFDAIVSYEHPSAIGPPLLYLTKSSVLLQRPDSLRVLTSGDGPASEFYLDGKTMTAFEPAANLAATAKAPKDVEDALQAAHKNAAIYYPWTDFVVADPWADLSDGLKRAFYIGQSKVEGGVTTDMVGIVSDEVFAQIWIGADDKLPRRMRAVFSRDPSRLRHDLQLTNWKLGVAVPAGSFTSAQAAAAKPIPFRAPEPTAPPAGAPAPAKKQ